MRPDALNVHEMLAVGESERLDKEDGVGGALALTSMWLLSNMVGGAVMTDRRPRCRDKGHHTCN